MKTTFIYGLIDPRTQQCRYIGKADDPYLRWQRHLQPRRLREITLKNTWILGVLHSGTKPELVILEEIAKHSWVEAEQWWIAYLRFIGADLTNGTRGGDGGSFPGEKNPMYGRRGPAHPAYGKPRPKEVMERIAAAQRGQKRNLAPEHVERIRKLGKEGIGEKNPFYGCKHSEETKRKWSEKRKGVRLSQKVKDILVEARTRRWQREWAQGRHGAITIDGVTKGSAEWAKESGIAAGTIRARIKRGWPPYQAVFAPHGK